MKNPTINYLENKENLGAIFHDSLANLDIRYTVKDFKLGDYIYLPKEYSDTVYFIIEGQVKTGTYSDNGKEITKFMLEKGEIFGESVLIGQQKRLDFAVAMSPTSVYVVKTEQMKKILRSHGYWNMFLMKSMGSRLRDMEKRLESLVFKNSRSRIVEYIKDTAIRSGKRIGFETEIRTSLTHREVASITNTSRQTVTTIFNELRNNNIITFNRKRILIRDMAKLI